MKLMTAERCLIAAWSTYVEGNELMEGEVRAGEEVSQVEAEKDITGASLAGFVICLEMTISRLD